MRGKSINQLPKLSTVKKPITLLLLLSAFAAAAQNVTIKGQVKGSQEEEIPFASIVFKSMEDSSKVYGTLGDAQGSFSIKVPQDRYVFEISFVGIQPKIMDLDLLDKGSDWDMGVIEVETDVSLEEVVVSGERKALKIDLDKKTYNVSQDLVARGGTLTDVMQNLPSVQVESDGNVSIRGDANVRILIDGKPSGLASSAELFATIPASSIEKVEVITNPSSKYSAQGTAGIINVVLKKGQKRRFNSSLEIFTGYRLTGGINGNIAQSGATASWYANAGIGYSEPKATSDIFLRTPTDIPDISTQESDRVRNQYYYLVNLGGTKNFNPYNSLSGSLTYRGARSDNLNATNYEDFQDDSLIGESNRTEREEEVNGFVYGNASFDHRFKKEGHQLSLTVSGEYTKGEEEASIDGLETFPSSQLLNRDVTTNEEEISRIVLSADYALPLKSDAVLELGYRSDLFAIENDFSAERQSPGLPVLIPEFTDRTNYDEKVHAVYGQLSKTMGKLFVKVGMRTEISDIDIFSARNDFNNSKNYTNWFPSAFLNYAFDEKNKLQLSASRRINRPQSWMIIPFSTFTDERNIFVGNSDIDPSYLLATELGLRTRASDQFSFYPSIYFRRTTDEMEFFVERQQITIGSESQDFFASTIANIGTYTAYGTELGASYEPFPWWSMYVEIVLNGFRQRGSFRGASFDGDGVLVSGRYNFSLHLFGSTKLQIQNYYRGPIETGQYRRKGFYGMNLALSSNIWKGNGSLTVNVRDVFNSNRRLVTTFGEDFTRDLDLQYRVRQVNLSLTYRFNQKQHKGKKGNQYDSFEIVN